jgi:hypothetical protein
MECGAYPVSLNRVDLQFRSINIAENNRGSRLMDKMRFKTLLSVAILFAGFSATHVWAQDDDNFYVAKGVIGQVLAKGEYRGAPYYQKVHDIENIDGNANWTIYTPHIIRSESRSDCIDHIWVGPMTVDATMGNEHREGFVVLNPSDFDLDWSELISARADGENVMILWKGASRESSIHYGTDESAVTVARNINILRRQCTPAQ